MHTIAIPGISGINSLDEIPDVVKFIRNRFAQVAGVKSVQILIRGRNLIPIYVFVDKDAAAKCSGDMVFPREVGLRYNKAELNEEKYPRLWLEERLAEVNCDNYVRDRGLTLEWVTFLEDREGHRTSVT